MSRRSVVLSLALGALVLHAGAQAGTTFRLDRAQAAPGETVTVEAVYFNDGDTASQWTPADRLVLQWRDAAGRTVRSLAYLGGDAVPASVPVNNFARVTWQAVVPPGVTGLQAVGIEGEPTLLALEVSGREDGVVAGTRAVGPIVDAGEPGVRAGTGEPLPPTATAGLGVDGGAGPAPNEVHPAGSVSYSSAAWEHFRNALSPYEPIYFVVGTREGTNARFQISFKYRLFQPPRDRAPAFHENLYVGYTQTSLWDLDSPSKPFYDTTYNPSLFWSSDALWTSPDRRWSLGLASGVEHQSNGRDGEDSRSWNAAFVQPALNYRFDGGSTLSFAPRVRGYFSVADENGDIADYRGRVDWNLRWAQDDGMMLSALLRQGRSGRNGVQIDFAYPLRGTWLSNLNGYFHVQYWNGYGQTLLNYDARQPSQVRAGLMFVR